jgi:hypothetical protein
MGRLGHATPSMAIRYQHVAQGRDDEIASGKITAHRVGSRLIRIDLDEIEAKIIHTVPTVNSQS